MAALHQAAALRDEAAGLAEGAEKLVQAAGVTVDVSPALALADLPDQGWESEGGKQRQQHDRLPEGKRGCQSRLQAGLLWAQGGAGALGRSREAVRQLREAAEKVARATQLFLKGAHRCVWPRLELVMPAVERG